MGGGKQEATFFPKMRRMEAKDGKLELPRKRTTCCAKPGTPGIKDLMDVKEKGRKNKVRAGEEKE